MSVHYKFKSALDFDTIAFDGLHISVDDLKKAILHQKRLGKTVDFDLQITNAQTKEEYNDDATLIPKNTSLIIARIPLARQPKKAWDPTADKGQSRSNQNESEPTNADLLRMNGSEEDKINAMMIQSTMDYDPNNYQKIRGANQTGEVPANYRCYKCHNPGHWIKNCPLNLIGDAGSDVKRNTGIPRSFIDGQNDTIVQPTTAPIAEKKHEIPEDLLCSICKDLYADAVMIPCCGSSFCDECVRTALLESEDNECPDCKEKGSSPGSLIPNRFLRNSVNAFKNETGYTKARPPPKPQVQPTQPVAEVVEPAASPKEVTEETNASTPAEEADNEKAETEKPDEKIADEQRAETPHEESDYEDNITVTVPPAHLQSGEAFRDFHLNGRGRHSHMESSKHHHIHVHQQHSHDHEEGSDTPTNDEKDVYQDLPEVKQHHHERPPPNYHHQQQQQQHHMHQHQPQQMPIPQPEQYQQMPPSGYPHQNAPQQRPYDQVYAHQQPNYPPRQYDQHMQHRPQMQHRGGGGYHGGPPMQHQMRHRFGPMQPSSITSVYQGVAAKIGSGIIDDPLEAFNRIMREKERRKEERRASPPIRRRSRSNEPRRRSPIADRRRTPPRVRSPDIRRRSPERRGRSRSEERRRKRSHSYDTRLSRSFSRSRSRSIRRHSRSPQPRKRTRSPRRISRSRSPSFSISRSRSRSKSASRYKAPLHSIRYRSPPRASPRNRFRDGNRRTERRDDFNRERDDFRDRDRSPGYYSHRGRSSYRGRGRSHFRHERVSNMPMSIPSTDYNNYQAPAMTTSGYDDGQYHLAPRYIPPGRGLSPGQQMQPRLSEYLPPPMHIVTPSSIDPVIHYDDPNRYDDAPPGTQPPPPGEQSPVEQFSRDREKWNPELDRHRRSPDKSALPTFDERRHTPDLRDRLNAEAATGQPHRSTSRTGNDHHRSDRTEKRRHSKTPTHRDGRKDETSRDRGRDAGRDSGRDAVRDSGRDAVRDSGRDAGRDGGRDDKHDKSDKSSIRKESERERDRSTKDVKDRHRVVEKTDDRDVKREMNDRKAKEKKKKKKEEKALEKKKKKERKEKEKREKELRKEQDRARKLLESNSDRKSDDNEEQINKTDQPHHESKEQNSFDENSGQISKELYDDVPNTPEKQVTLQQTSENIRSTKMDDFDIDGVDDTEGNKSEMLNIRTSAQSANEAIRNDENSMDLYGDIVGDDLDMGYTDGDATNSRRVDQSSPAHTGVLNRSDSILDNSILDIHANLDFEHEMDEIEPDAKKSAQGYLPELSKWEREDEMYLYGDKKSGSDTSPYDESNAGKVTNEVLKRAENAIFTRAINAIRPIEIKKISTERLKLYANEKRENTPDGVGVADDIQSNMKITVPVFTNEERSVELKTDIRVERDRTKTPVRSIKDRLGSKVHNSPRSRTRTPPRRLLVDNGHSEKDRSRDRNRRDDRARDGGDKRVVSSSNSRSNDTRRIHDTKRGGVTKVDKERDDQRTNRDHGRDDKHEKSNRNTKESDRDRSTKDVKDRHRLGDKPDHRLGDKPDHRLVDKPDDRDHRQKDREKEKERARQMARAREMERIKEMNRKQMDKDKSDKRDGKRERSDSTEVKHRREQAKEEKKPKLEVERSSAKHLSERKRSTIDESEFVPDYDESVKKTESLRRKPVDSKHKEPEKRKSRSNSESSSSSDSDSSDSSDSDDKKRKKRKHKKQKRSKRASSSESDESSKKKKSKHKKSKKKKKGKAK